jgi:hypothetical protein
MTRINRAGPQLTACSAAHPLPALARGRGQRNTRPEDCLSLKPWTQQRHDFRRLRVAAKHRLREDQLAVDVNIEDAAGSGYNLDRANFVLKLLEYLRRQTDGVLARPSGDAVLDPNQRRFGHRPILASAPASGGVPLSALRTALTHMCRYMGARAVTILVRDSVSTVERTDLERRSGEPSS